MTDHDTREREMMELAGKLQFEVEKHGDRFSLRRELVEDDEPVRRDDLTLQEAEEILNRWKLRGLHGG